MTLDDLLEKLEGQHESRINSIFTTLNTELKTDLTSTQPGNHAIPVAAIARLILFHALSKSDDSKGPGKSASANTAQWKAVCTDVTEFVSKLPSSVNAACFNVYSADKIAQFATFSSRTKGASSNFFYSTLVLYLIYLHDSGIFDKAYLLSILPKEDLKLAANLATLLSRRIDRNDSQLATGTNTQDQSTSFESAVRFNILQPNNVKLTNFIKYYSSGEKNGAHLVMYRAMRSDPTRLMKTFLILSPPKEFNDGANNAVFSHFYKAPNEKRENKLRFSGGKALPLDQGVYLVGGQRPWTPDHVRHPFSSLKVLAFEWIDLNQCHPLMSVVIMSTNYKGQIFVSRAVARITPFVHHRDQNLDAIKLSELESSLLREYEQETRYLTGEMESSDGKLWTGSNESNFLCHLEPEDVPAAAQYIKRNTNNNPRGNAAWGVVDGFTRQNDKAAETLTNAKLQSAVEDSLVNNKNNTFVNELGEPYDIWSSTRFGPISSDS